MRDKDIDILLQKYEQSFQSDPLTFLDEPDSSLPGPVLTEILRQVQAQNAAYEKKWNRAVLITVLSLLWIPLAMILDQYELTLWSNLAALCYPLCFIGGCVTLGYLYLRYGSIYKRKRTAQQLEQRLPDPTYPPAS